MVKNRTQALGVLLLAGTLFFMYEVKDGSDIYLNEAFYFAVMSATEGCASSWTRRASSIRRSWTSLVNSSAGSERSFYVPKTDTLCRKRTSTRTNDLSDTNPGEKLSKHRRFHHFHGGRHRPRPDCLCPPSPAVRDLSASRNDCLWGGSRREHSPGGCVRPPSRQRAFLPNVLTHV